MKRSFGRPDRRLPGARGGGGRLSGVRKDPPASGHLQGSACETDSQASSARRTPAGPACPWAHARPVCETSACKRPAFGERLQHADRLLRGRPARSDSAFDGGPAVDRRVERRLFWLAADRAPCGRVREFHGRLPGALPPTRHGIPLVAMRTQRKAAESWLIGGPRAGMMGTPAVPTSRGGQGIRPLPPCGEASAATGGGRPPWWPATRPP